MRPRIKLGLLIGGIALLLNICVSTALGICGPAVALLAGGLAGFLTAQQEKPLTKGDGARAGAVSGAIAGGLVCIGQVIGGLGALLLVQQLGLKPVLGTIPSSGGEQVAYYLTGLGTGACFGVVGLVLAALVGAGCGYLGTSAPASPLSQGGPLDV